MSRGREGGREGWNFVRFFFWKFFFLSSIYPEKDNKDDRDRKGIFEFERNECVLIDSFQI